MAPDLLGPLPYTNIMDATFVATPMVAEAVVMTVKVFIMAIVHKVTSLVERVAYFVRLSIGGTSLSAVAPDHILEGGTA